MKVDVYISPADLQERSSTILESILPTMLIFPFRRFIISPPDFSFFLKETRLIGGGKEKKKGKEIIISPLQSGKTNVKARKPRLNTRPPRGESENRKKGGEGSRGGGEAGSDFRGGPWNRNIGLGNAAGRARLSFFSFTFAAMHLRLFFPPFFPREPRSRRPVTCATWKKVKRRKGEEEEEERKKERGEGKKEKRKGRAGRTQYIVGGYLRRKRHEQQIDGRPPGPEWVLRGPPNERHNLPPSSPPSFLALAISSLSRLIVRARNAPGHRPA